MKPRLFPSGGVGIVVNSQAIDSSPACSARTGWQAGAAAQAGSMLPEFSAQPLPDEKIHRFHLARYGLGLVWQRGRSDYRRSGLQGRTLVFRFVNPGRPALCTIGHTHQLQQQQPEKAT